MRYRAVVIPVLGIIAVLAGFLVSGNLNQNLVYNLTPTEAVAQQPALGDGERFRLGGLVQEGSIIRDSDEVRFTLVDDTAAVPVVYAGVPAQLFAAGIGAVVEGAWRGDRFYADTMMIKHDEDYVAEEPADGGDEEEAP